jgi:SAM-dependent MidA family methyltransferase
MTLAARLRQRIASAGPLPFEEFMAACLYDPTDGFFASGPLRSTKSGDFLTSPEVSPWFGRTIGRHVEAIRRELRNPNDFVVAEVGAGSGSLLQPLLREMGSPLPTVWAAEASPAARRRLGEVLDDHRVVGDLSQLPSRITGVILANELLDNLPTALAVRTVDGWEERRVDVGDDETFQLVSAAPRPSVAAWAERYGEGAPVGGMVEVQLAAGSWVSEALGRLEAGALIVIDYGGTAEELVPRRTQGTLRTYRAHHLGPDPLEAPGETDITADVNFSALLETVAEAGWRADVVRQDDYLAQWGLRDVVSGLRRKELELARSNDALARLAVRSERTDADTLMHPRGLGDFRVLIAKR